MPELDELSERESEILELVAEGNSNKEIAESLIISANTVKVHLRNIYAKLEVSSRTEAAIVLHGARDKGASAADTGDTIPDPLETGAREAAEPVPELPAAPTSARPLRPPWQQPLVLIAGAVVMILAGLGLSQLLPTPETAPEPIIESPAYEEARWSDLSPLSSPLQDPAVVVVDNRVYIIAGLTADGPSSTVTSYDPEADAFEIHRDKPTAVSAAQATVLGGRIYVPGGFDKSGMPTAQLDIYDTLLDEWHSGAELPVRLAAYAMVAFEGKLYVFGGRNEIGFSNQVYSYLPADDSWAEQSPIPGAGRAFAGAAVSGSSIFLIGGYDGDHSLVENWAYDPNKDRAEQSAWEAATALPEGRHAMGTASVAGVIHIIGGQSDTPGSFIQMEYSPQDKQWLVVRDPLASTWSNMGVGQVETGLHVIGGLIDGRPTRRNMIYQAIFFVAIPFNP